MLQGGAFDEEAKKAMKNTEVYDIFRLLPVSLELAVRETKWLQQMAGNQAAHQQVLGEIFGEYTLEGETVFQI